MSLVSFVKVDQSDHYHLKHAILDSLNLVRYRLSSNLKNVVIKPNMCYYWDYSTGQTTNPKFIAALIDVIRDQISPDVNISIVESDASAMKCKYAFNFLGYEKMAENHDVTLVNLSEDKSERVEVSAGGQSFHFMIPKTIQNADLRINVPKIKYLVQTKISCTLKNIFGCNPYPKKFKYHPKLDETIVALNKVMKFDLCILDGIIVSGTQPRKLGLIMASRDPVALDFAAAKIAGVNPKSVSHIMLAGKEGIGNTSFIPKGANPTHFAKRYPRRSVAYKTMSLGYKLALNLGLGKRLGLSD